MCYVLVTSHGPHFDHIINLSGYGMACDEEELDTCRFFNSYPDSEASSGGGCSGSDGLQIQVAKIQTHY